MNSPFDRRLLRLATLATAALCFGATCNAAGADSAVPANAEAMPQGAGSCPSHEASPPMLTDAVPSLQIYGPSSIGSLFTDANQVTVVDQSTRTTTTVTSSGAKAAATSLAIPDARPGWVARDSTGATYVLRYPYTLAKIDASGKDVWSYAASEPLTAVFTYGTDSGERVGVEFRDRPRALTFTIRGERSGETDIRGSVFDRTADGGMIVTDSGRYIRRYDATGRQVFLFGDSHRDNDPAPAAAPLHFYQLGGAAVLPDGRYLVTDTRRGLMLFSSTGMFIGAVAPTQLDADGLTQQSSIIVSNDAVYLAVGKRFTANQRVVRVSLRDVLARVTWSTADSSLGAGAGLFASAPGNYTPPGETPMVKAVFDPWWQSVSVGMTLCWRLRSAADLKDGSPGFVTTVPSARWVFGSDGLPLQLPAGLSPGAYTIDASLLQAGKPVTSTTMIMTVGAAGQKLDLKTLPPGADWGGPAPARGAALADELGTGAVREQLDWKRLLAIGSTGPMDFSFYDTRIADGAAEAARRKVTFIVQIGQGGPERALVDNGTWAARVREVVAHFARQVHVWEAWNEPNLTFGAAADYVAKVLAPVYSAVKSEDSTALVVGGSVCNVDLAYWRGIIAAGGLQYLDIASVHPYPGHNRTWEEQGIVGQLRELKALLVRNGREIPLWNTELAWWSDGWANILRQADASSRAMLWMAALGVNKWAYFIPEGGWGNYGLSFSAIQVSDYVKPAALAMMTTSDQLAGRPFLGEVALGAPSAYAMRFGPKPNVPSSGELLVAWTDDVNLPFVLSADAPGREMVQTGELGDSTRQSVKGFTRLMLTGSPVFLALTGPGRLNLSPDEQFGPDLALSTAGATATASSMASANPAAAAIDGESGAAGRGDLPGMPVWASANGMQQQATLTVTLDAPRQLDRILISGHSIGSIVPGLRDYNVVVRSDTTTTWRTVAEVRGEFYNRQKLLRIPTQQVVQIRIEISKLNCSGTNADGSPPTWWVVPPPAAGEASPVLCGPAVVSELAAYGPGAGTPASSSPTPGTTPSPAAGSAPLAAPKQASTLRIHVQNSIIRTGSMATISVYLKTSSAPVPGSRIALQRNGATAAQATTGKDGAATLRVTVRHSAIYRVKFVGNSGVVASTSASFRIVAVDATRSRLRVIRSLKRSRPYDVVAGTVRLARNGVALSRVRIEIWRKSKQWTRVAILTSNAAGKVLYRAPKLRPHHYRIIFRGSAMSGGQALPSASKVVKV